MYHFAWHMLHHHCQRRRTPGYCCLFLDSSGRQEFSQQPSLTPSQHLHIYRKFFFYTNNAILNCTFEKLLRLKKSKIRAWEYDIKLRTINTFNYNKFTGSWYTCHFKHHHQQKINCIFVIFLIHGFIDIDTILALG